MRNDLLALILKFQITIRIRIEDSKKFGEEVHNLLHLPTEFAIFHIQICYHLDMMLLQNLPTLVVELAILSDHRDIIEVFLGS